MNIKRSKEWRALVNWEDEGFSNLTTQDAAYTLFTKTGTLSWVDVLNLSRDLYNEMFNESVAEYSAVDTVITAASCGAYDAALRAVCLMLGIKEVESFSAVVSDYVDKRERGESETLTFDEMIRRVNEHESFRRRLRNPDPEMKEMLQRTKDLGASLGIVTKNGK